MQPSTTVVFLLAIFLNLLPKPTKADFLIYYGASNQFAPAQGEAMQSEGIILFSTKPDCYNTPRTAWLHAGDNDINSWGDFSCDGCYCIPDEDCDAIANMPITRLEFLDEESSPITNEALDDIVCFFPFLSLFANNALQILYPHPGREGEWEIHWKKPDGSRGVPGDHGYCIRTHKEAYELSEAADVLGPCGGPFETYQLIQLFACITPLEIVPA